MLQVDEHCVNEGYISKRKLRSLEAREHCMFLCLFFMLLLTGVTTSYLLPWKSQELSAVHYSLPNHLVPFAPLGLHDF